MSRFAANYRVTLRSNLSGRESALISALGAQVAGSRGEPLYQLTCTEVSFSERYLEAKVFREPEDWLLPLYIPHEFVLLVSGGGESYPAGFGP
jgi:hypothetical protein